MTRIRLIHWDIEEARLKAQSLQGWGYEVDSEPLDTDALKRLKTAPPEAVVIDLSRIPSQGRDVALALRTAKATRFVPLVFVGGVPEKVNRVRDQLPDATFSDWDHLRENLDRSILNPVADPIVPPSNLSGYSGTPLPKKLGIKPDMVVGLLGAPDDFAETLGELPPGVKMTPVGSKKVDLRLWFVRSRCELEDGIEAQKKSMGSGGMWILWPKKASGVVSDLTQTVVRETGLSSDLVDYKVCSVDKTWSGLKFTRRRKKA